MQFTKRPGKFLLSLGLLVALACASEAASTTKPTSVSKHPTSTTTQTSTTKPSTSNTTLTSVSKHPTSITTQTSSTQQSSNQQLRQALQQLRAIEKTLAAADHDYGGHRVDAMRDVHSAGHQLHEALEHAHYGQKHSGATTGSQATQKPSATSTTKTSGTSATKGKSEPEPQALSDQQLGTAVQELEQTISTLKQSEHDYGGHREKAVAELEKALHQLKKALHYSKEKNQSQS